MSLVVVVAVIVLLLALNALYVAAEFSAISARRARVSNLADDGSRRAKTLLPFLESPRELDRYIAACQVGITLSSLMVGFYGQAQLSPYLGFGLSTGVAAIIVLIFLTTLQVIFGEIVPKSVALRYPERLALVTVLPLRWSLFILRPFIALFNGSALLLLKLFGIESKTETHAHSPEELEMVFSESAQGGFLDLDEQEMLANVLQFETRLGRQIMIPRNRMVSVDVSEPPAEALARLVQTPHMRFPVYDGVIDTIVGVLNLKDLFSFVQMSSSGTLHDVLREVPLIPETNTVSEVWDTLKQRQNHMAVLFDEYGGTVGLVTLEDIIEEIVGEVQDEFDDEEQRIEQHGDRVNVRGDVLVITLNRQFLLQLPENEADTIGGLMLEELERAPEVGDEVTVGDVTLQVTSISENAVTGVGFILPDTAEDETENEAKGETKNKPKDKQDEGRS